MLYVHVRHRFRVVDNRIILLIIHFLRRRRDRIPEGIGGMSDTRVRLDSAASVGG